MDRNLIEKVMQQVQADMNKLAQSAPVCKAASDCCAAGVTEFVGTAIGDTIGLVIASVDPLLVDKMNLGKFRSIGIFGGRTGAGPQIMAVDEAVKATNTEVISIEMPRDTKGGAGHGALILIGAEDVSDARRAVEIALSSLDKYFGDVYGNAAGHLEFQYTARASYCIEKAFGAPLGKAFGLVLGAPAAIGTVLCDVAVKAANVDVISYCSPGKGTSLTNEAFIAISGDSGAVRQAIRASINVGRKLLGALDVYPESTTTPYI